MELSLCWVLQHWQIVVDRQVEPPVLSCCVHGPPCTSEACLAESRSDLHIPAGPAWTDRTAGAEEASHSAWSPSPASSSPCPSQASRMPFSAAWSECKGKAQKINARARLFPPVVAAVGCEEIVTFRCSLRDAVILDFRYKKKKNQQCLVNYKSIIMTKMNE